jgi:hypothetical protein
MIISFCIRETPLPIGCESRAERANDDDHCSQSDAHVPIR